MRCRWLAWVLLLGVWGTADGAGPRKDRCVVLVSIDGLAGFYLDDPRANLPTLRRLAAEGVRAEGTVCSFPTVTWPNHTTLVTGVPPARHGVLGNNYLDRTSGEKVALIPDPLFDKDQIVQVPTIYDVAHQAGLSTAGIIWPATRNARTLDWTVPDMGGDAWEKYGTPAWMAELREAGIPVEKHGEWVKESSGGVQRDWLYTRLAQNIFRHHPVNLMLIHLIEVDHVQHKFGPRTPEAYWAVSYADDRLRDIVEAAESSEFAGNTTFVIVSDHGFFPIDKDIRPNVKLKQLGLVTAKDANNVTDKQAWCVSQGGGCMVYVLDAARRAELTQQLKSELAGIEGVERVYTADQFAQIGQASPQQDQRAPDLWLAARSGYSFTDSHAGDDVVVAKESRAGTHGYRPDQPEMYGTLILAGKGIKRGGRLGVVSNLDVAPTMATLLGLELPSAEGRPLTAALAD